MESFESANISDSLPLEGILTSLREHPVELAILFGSHATGSTHQTSDIDIAVEFDSVERDDQAYNDVFLALRVDLTEVLGIDDIDLADVHTLSSGVTAAIIEHGVVLVGDQIHAEKLYGPSQQHRLRNNLHASNSMRH